MILETRFGPAWASITPEGALTAFGFGLPIRPAEGESALVAQQVAEYFAGTRRNFELDRQPKGTPFQTRVWAELLKIPYGETRTYSQLAELAGIPKSPRAAGRGNATNPIALVIPCHRVIGSNGSLTGYAYGTELKRRLLEWERQVK